MCLTEVRVDVQTLIASLIGIVVAILTWLLAAVSEQFRYKQKRRDEERARVENLYVEKIALIERCMRITRNLDDYKQLEIEIARCNALMRLVAPANIIEQSEAVTDILLAWSTEYRAGSPKRTGTSGIGFISSADTPHLRRAEELFPQLNDVVNKLIALMKQHLDTLSSLRKSFRR